MLAALDRLGIAYRIDRKLVRGLDYYVHTVFELNHSGLGAQTAIAGGGRYELYLPGQNKPVPGVGFAAGAERLLLARESLGITDNAAAVPAVYLIGLGEAARIENLRLADRLRAAGLRVELEVEERSMKAQMRAANRSGARLALVRGDNELAAGIAQLKNMADGSQREIAGELFKEILAAVGTVSDAATTAPTEGK